LSHRVIQDNRIQIDPNPPVGGRNLTVRYRGLLANSGADSVFLHCGYGNGAWANVQDIMMHPRGDGWWETGVPVESRVGDFNFCFKDSASNWDNNNGFNWKASIIT